MLNQRSQLMKTQQPPINSQSINPNEDDTKILSKYIILITLTLVLIALMSFYTSPVLNNRQVTQINILKRSHCKSKRRLFLLQHLHHIITIKQGRRWRK